MTRIIAAAIVLAIGAPLAGCGMPQGAPSSPAYAPYDRESNPFCGALGNCAPATPSPYPLRGNIS